MTTGLADFKASFAQTEVASNPARITEKDTFAYELSQKTSITGTSQLDRAISQQQQSHLKARYHAPIKADAQLALDLSPNSQNYKYITVDDSASSSTTIAYDKGALAKATLEMQAHQTTRVLKYTLGKLKDDQTTPSGKSMTRDLLSTLEPERDGLPALSDEERAQVLAKLNNQIFLQSNPDAIPKT
jgi:DNA relaxase NicK